MPSPRPQQSCPGLILAVLCAFIAGSAIATPLRAAAVEVRPEWPAASAEARPWSYWWWLGSAVSREGLTRSLEAFREAGLGGVHVIPIYGVPTTSSSSRSATSHSTPAAGSRRIPGSWDRSG